MTLDDETRELPLNGLVLRLQEKCLKKSFNNEYYLCQELNGYRCLNSVKTGDDYLCKKE